MTTALLVSSNGVGLGHVTRLLAVARRFPAGCDAVLLTLSPAVEVLRSSIDEHAGVARLEHLPGAGWAGLGQSEWHGLLRDRIIELVHADACEVVVFDGIHPYGGLVQAARGLDVPFVWIRRGLWRTRAKAHLRYVSAFDLVIAPGEVAGPDQSVPIGDSPRVLAVPPVLRHDAADLLSPEDARDRLKLDATPEPVLVALGDSDPSILKRVCTALLHSGWRPVVLRPPFGELSQVPRGVEVRRAYPVAPLLSAFAFVVAGAGYNTANEIAACRVPAVLVPSRRETDDQFARAVRVASAGPAVVWQPTSPEPFASAVQRLRDTPVPVWRGTPAVGSRGAEQAAAAITALVWSSPAPDGRPWPAPDGRPSPAPDGRPSPAPDGRPSPAPGGRPSSAPGLWVRSSRGVVGGSIYHVLRGAYALLLRVLPAVFTQSFVDQVARVRHRLPPVPLPRGPTRVRVPGPTGADTVLIVTLGSDADRVAALTRHVEDSVSAGRVRTRAVWVVDCDDLTGLGGRVTEQLPPVRDRTPDPDAWTDRRLGMLMGTYRPTRVLTVAPTGPLPSPVFFDTSSASIRPRWPTARRTSR